MGGRVTPSTLTSNFHKTEAAFPLGPKKPSIHAEDRMNTRLRLLSNKAVSGQKQMMDAFNSFGISVIDSNGKQRKASTLAKELLGRCFISAH